MNYLASLMAQKIAPIPDATFLKCLNLTLEHHSARHRSDQNEDSNNSMIFTHSFISNIALVFSARAEKLKEHDEQTFDKLINLIF